LILHSDKEIHELERLKEEAFYNLLESGIKKLNPEESNLGFDGYDRLRDLMQEIITSWRRHFSADPNRIYNFLVERSSAMKKLLDAKKGVYTHFNKVIVLGSISIIFPLMSLPFGTKILDVSECLSWILISFGLFLGFICVFYSMYSSWKITKL